ncbi:MAG: DUF354 domain-containing protein [Candidatus Methanofastidiosa archaeon]|nr:DUF354 domain-containing protein [Candidatus Methanofastidiosa archaeon]
MRVIIDIGHPAHVHYFKNLTIILQEEGYKILFTCRQKDIISELLEKFRFKYIPLGKSRRSIPGKIFGILLFDLKLLKHAISSKPDLFLSAGSIYAAHVSFVMHKPHITLEDTFNMEQVNLYLPFTSVVFTGCYPHKNLGSKEIQYKGFQELTYLHPKYFSADKTVRDELSLTVEDKYFIVRFVSWEASHDIGRRGLTNQQKLEILKLLEKYGKVFVSAEGCLPSEFQRYIFPLPPDRMHHALAFAHLYVGEGATMASECAMLGTTAVYINSNEAGSIDEQENFGLIYHFRSPANMLEKIRQLAEDPFLKEKSRMYRNSLIEGTIDLTAFLVWVVKYWPESLRILKENPEYQERFK